MRRLGYNPGRDQLGAKKSWARLSTLAFAYPNCERLATLVGGKLGTGGTFPNQKKWKTSRLSPVSFTSLNVQGTGANLGHQPFCILADHSAVLLRTRRRGGRNDFDAVIHKLSIAQPKRGPTGVTLLERRLTAGLTAFCRWMKNNHVRSFGVKDFARPVSFPVKLLSPGHVRDESWY